MTMHVALLRGVNVGRAKRVAMADLRRLFEALGFERVRTLLNSGNVVFEAGAKGPLAPRIERALADELGLSARVTVLPAAELARILGANPLRAVAKDPARLLVTVLARPADARRLAPLARQDWAPEALAVGPRAAYLWCPGGVSASRVWKAVERALADGATSRNAATMAKLLALAQAGGLSAARRPGAAPARRRAAPARRAGGRGSRSTC